MGSDGLNAIHENWYLPWEKLTSFLELQFCSSIILRVIIVTSKGGCEHLMRKCVCVFVYIYIYRERERERETETETETETERTSITLMPVGTL